MYILTDNLLKGDMQYVGMGSNVRPSNDRLVLVCGFDNKTQKHLAATARWIGNIWVGEMTGDILDCSREHGNFLWTEYPIGDEASFATR